MIPLPPEGVTAFLRACNPVDYSGFMEKMTLLGELLYETNESFNLTAIKPDGFWCRHVADSLSPAFAMPDFFKTPKHICDLGCVFHRWCLRRRFRTVPSLRWIPPARKSIM